MPTKSSNVSLSIATAVTTGYTQCKDGSGNLVNGYYYQFTGGDDGKGNVTEGTRGEVLTVTVSLDSGSNGAYNITGARWKTVGDTHGSDMSLATSGNKVTVTDYADASGEIGKYDVIVQPRNSTTTNLYCDPTVSNQWD